MNKDIKHILSELRNEIYNFREDRKDYFIPSEINAVEISLNLVEFSLKRKKAITEVNEMWFYADYYLAHGLQGTQWERIYYLYMHLKAYVIENKFFNENQETLEW